MPEVTPPAAPPADPAAPTAPPVAPTSAAPAATGFDAAKYDPKDIATWPDEVQKAIREVRRESEGYRTKATTAEQTRQETMDKIAAALGLKPDDDPAKAAQTAADERDAARKEATSTKRENAVLRLALKAGADPESLTDSRSFMAKLEAIDPAADDFAAQVGTAIKTAVEANPNLKSATASPPARSGGPVGGGATISGQLSREDLKGMSPAEIDKAREDGRLNTLLGITA